MNTNIKELERFDSARPGYTSFEVRFEDTNCRDNVFSTYVELEVSEPYSRNCAEIVEHLGTCLGSHDAVKVYHDYDSPEAYGSLGSFSNFLYNIHEGKPLKFTQVFGKVSINQGRESYVVVVKVSQYQF